MMHAPADSGDIDTTAAADSFTRPAHPPADLTAPAAPCPPSAPAGLPVACWVPREVRDRVDDDAALVIYAALIGYARPPYPGALPVARVQQDTLANVAHVDERTVRRTVAVLRAAGLVRTWRTHQRAATRYELQVNAGDQTRWDVVPRALMRAVQTGAVTRGAVRTWLHLDQALGQQGRTRDSVTEFADRTGYSKATVRRQVHQLATLGLLVVHDRPGVGWTLTRPGFPAMPAGLDHVVQSTAETSHLLHYRHGDGAEHEQRAAEQAVTTPVEPIGTGGRGPVENSGTALTGVRSPRSLVSGPGTTPVSTTPESNNLPAFLPQDRRLPNARTTTTSGEPKQKRIGGQGRAQDGGPGAAGGRRRAPVARVETRQDVAAVLGALPGEWLGGPARRWRPGIAAAIAVALDAGAPVPAVVRAVVELGDLDAADGRHVLAVRGALATLCADVRLGLACNRCGGPLDRPQAPCEPCTAADGPTTTGTASVSALPAGPADKRLDQKTPAAGVALVDDLPPVLGHELDDEQQVPAGQRIAAYTDLGLSADDVRALGDHHAAELMTATAATVGASLPSPDDTSHRPIGTGGSPGSPAREPRARLRVGASQSPSR